MAPAPGQSIDTTVSSSLSITRRYLSGWPLVATRTVAGLILAISIFVFVSIFSGYSNHLSTGYIGATCLTCNYGADSLIIGVKPDSPAEAAGIRSYDRVLAVDDTPIADFPEPRYAFELPGVAGKPGTPVNLTIQHPDGTVDDYEVIRQAGWLDASVDVFRLIGISNGLSIAFALASDILFFAFSVGIGLFIIWRRPNDWLILHASLACVIIGFWSTRSAYLPGRLFTSIFLDYLLVLLLAFFFVFPSGRLIPRWGWIPPVLYFIWLSLVDLVLVIPPHILPLMRMLDIPYWLIAVIAQVYRYVKASTAEERQQTKWVLIAFVYIIVVGFASTMMATAFPALRFSENPGAVSLFYRSFSLLFTNFSALFLPIALVFAMLRYRLWDVDFVINRSLIYGSLTVLLAGVFATVLLAFPRLYEALLGQGAPALTLILGTLAVAALFQPARVRIRRLVDRRLYGIQVDYRKAEKKKDAQTSRQPVRQAAGIDTHFPEYSDIRFLTRGGMGDIYVARHQHLKRSVAIKMLREDLAQSESNRARFIREAQTLAELRHENIIQVFDFGENEAGLYMVMEFVQGEDLKEILKNTIRFSVSDVLKLLKTLGDAIDYVHTKGIIHRDLKPANIMLEKARPGHISSDRPVLMDFGIARSVIQETSGGLTQTGTFVGTFNYMSPEQIQDADSLDGRIDIYSLGVITYELLTGELPFSHRNTAAVLIAHMQQPPPDPRSIVSDIPPQVADAVIKAMQKQPEDRFSTVKEMINAMQP